LLGHNAILDLGARAVKLAKGQAAGERSSTPGAGCDR